MDEERTYLNAIICIRDGFERKEKMSESMSKSMSELMSELERARMQIILIYLETNKEINSAAAAKLLEVEIKTASRLHSMQASRIKAVFLLLNGTDRLHHWDHRRYGFFLSNSADAVVNAGTDKVVFFHLSTGKNACLNLFSFGISDSETDGWIFMFVTHGNAPLILGVAAGIIDSLTSTWIYSL